MPSDTTRKHRCNVCGNRFLRIIHLRHHLLIHTGDKPHKCGRCGHRFRQQSNLNAHKRLHLQAGNKHKCNVCGKVFLNKLQLASHLDIHLNTPIHDCDTYGASFSDESSLKAHKKIQYSGTSFPVDTSKQPEHELLVPGKQNTTYPDVTRHLEPYTGNVCGTSFQKKHNLSCHLLIHADTSPHVCTYCGKHLMCNASLMTHIRVHTGERPFPCGNCGKRFNRNSNLTTHLAAVHGITNTRYRQNKRIPKAVHYNNVDVKEREVRYVCHICDKPYNSLIKLDKHTLTHKENRPYKCTICGKTLSRKGTFLDHRDFHTGKKPFKCDFCKDTFAIKRYVLDHLKKHTAHGSYTFDPCEAPTRYDSKESYPEETCDDANSQCNDMNIPFDQPIVRVSRCDIPNAEEKWAHSIHKQKSQREALYICHICDKPYNSLIKLDKHTLTHKENRPYKCTICGKTLSRRRIFLDHRDFHTGKKPFKCDFCQEAFAVKRYVLDHLKNHPDHGSYTYDPHEAPTRHDGNETYPQETCDGTNSQRCDMNIPFDQPTLRVSRRDVLNAGEKPARNKHKQNSELETNMAAIHQSTNATHPQIKKIPKAVHYTYNNVDLKEQNALYICHMCDKPYNSLIKLDKHTLTHKENRPYICTICGKTLSRKGTFLDHRDFHTGKKPFKCDFCQEAFAVKRYVLDHLKHTDHGSYSYDQREAPTRYDSKETYPEETCNGTNSQGSDMNIPFDQPTVRVSRCDVLNAGEKRARSIHKQKSQREARYVCHSCDKPYNSLINLEKHMLTHTEYIPYKCTICGKTLTRKGAFLDHRNLHTGKKPFKCDFCKETFAVKRYVLNHLKKHTDHGSYTYDPREAPTRHNGSETYPEETCDGTNSRRNGINISCKRPALAATKWDIPKAGKKLPPSVHKNTKLKSLKRHPTAVRRITNVTHLQNKRRPHDVQYKRVHTDASPHVCTTCGKHFVNKTNFIHHIRVHTGERPFPCGKCGKRFKQKSQLKTHLAVMHGIVTGHAVVKPFACEVCGKAFLFRCLLRYHEVKCQQSEAEINADHDKKHVVGTKSAVDTKATTGNCGIQLTCVQCGKHFERQYSLKNHVLTHHKSTIHHDHSNGSQDGASAASKSKMAKCKVIVQTKHKCTHEKLGVQAFSEGTYSDGDAHQIPYQDEEVFTCNSCGATFSKQADLVTHLLMHIE